MNCQEGREAGRGDAEGQQAPAHLCPFPFPGSALGSGCHQHRNLIWLPLLTIPNLIFLPLNLKQISIHQADLQGYYIKGKQWFSPIQVLKDLFWKTFLKGGAWN